jgi:hypothetical protein
MNKLVLVPAKVGNTAATYVPTYDLNGNIRSYMNLNATTAAPTVAWAMEYDAFWERDSLQHHRRRRSQHRHTWWIDDRRRY